ncbi:MAG: hypothetical protein E6J20_18600 [Chloroflexi bacterium]|nr:MAG: hypothetical protein E6J20_18600 [Chloroflexota bacterium]
MPLIPDRDGTKFVRDTERNRVLAELTVDAANGTGLSLRDRLFSSKEQRLTALMLAVMEDHTARILQAIEAKHAD